MARELFTLNAKLDRQALAAAFARDRRVQVRDLLSEAAAREVHQVLSTHTRWGLAWQAGDDGPHALESGELRTTPAERQRAIV
ncbi:MAG: hypothetical protein M3428_01895, partial [Pseudomonadota bacterium]|nr:hypothetical protein [Pseudomonadota bacterium]